MDYIDLLKERAKKSRVYTPHQMTGLTVAQILSDEKHKALYIKLAKKYDAQKLLSLAESVAQRKNVKNRGAYFMRILHSNSK